MGTGAMGSGGSSVLSAHLVVQVVLWVLGCDCFWEEADMLVSYVSVSKRTMLSGKCCQTPGAAESSYVLKTAQGLFTYIFKHPHTGRELNFIERQVCDCIIQ